MLIALSLVVGQPQEEGAEDPAACDRAPLRRRDAGGACGGGQGEAAGRSRVHGARRHPRRVVEEELTGGYRRIIRVPQNPETLEQVRGHVRRRLLRGARRGGPEQGLRGSRLAARLREQDREITDVFAGIAGASPRRDDLRCSSGESREGRSTLWVVVVAGVALAVAAPAGGADECEGLMVCVPVAGPWVVVPASTSIPRQRVEYQLTCPRAHVVGGLDARLSVRPSTWGSSALSGVP